jgi:hypothetical protein
MSVIRFWDPSEQGAMRDALRKLAIKERLTIVELAKMAGITARQMSSFLVKEMKGGPKLIIGVAHILDKYNVEL